jgi:hypothetical protein
MYKAIISRVRRGWLVMMGIRGLAEWKGLWMGLGGMWLTWAIRLGGLCISRMLSTHGLAINISCITHIYTQIKSRQQIISHNEIKRHTKLKTTLLIVIMNKDFQKSPFTYQIWTKTLKNIKINLITMNIKIPTKVNLKLMNNTTINPRI